MRIASTDGVTLVVHELGGPTDPAAPTILFAHATGFHGVVWRPLVAHLTNRYRCVSADLRGHGLATPPDNEQFEWSGFGRDVLAVIDGYGLTEAAARGSLYGVGHSKGGAALLMTEVARPGTFHALYVFEPIVFPPADEPVPEGQSNPLAQGARRRREVFASKDEAYANYASKPPLSRLDPDALRAYVDHGFEELPDGTVRLRMRGEWEARVFEMGGRHDTFARLHQIGCPVTVAASGDGMGPAQFAGAVAGEIPSGRLERFDDLDHFGPLTHPERIAHAIAAAFAAAG